MKGSMMQMRWRTILFNTLGYGLARKDKGEFDCPAAPKPSPETLKTFDACWETVKQRFYDKKLHGVDWDAIKAKYRPRAAKAKPKRTAKAKAGTKTKAAAKPKAKAKARASTKKQVSRKPATG